MVLEHSSPWPMLATPVRIEAVIKVDVGRVIAADGTLGVFKSDLVTKGAGFSGVDFCSVPQPSSNSVRATDSN